MFVGLLEEFLVGPPKTADPNEEREILLRHRDANGDVFQTLIKALSVDLRNLPVARSRTRDGWNRYRLGGKKVSARLRNGVLTLQPAEEHEADDLTG